MTVTSCTERRHARISFCQTSTRSIALATSSTRPWCRSKVVEEFLQVTLRKIIRVSVLERAISLLDQRVQSSVPRENAAGEFSPTSFSTIHCVLTYTSPKKGMWAETEEGSMVVDRSMQARCPKSDTCSGAFGLRSDLLAFSASRLGES
jgi:hypothetical protein